MNQNPSIIYHLCERNVWENAQNQGIYENPSLDSEGFIHCSKADQLEEVANRYYAGNTNLLVLVIDTCQLTPEIIWEDTSGHGVYPHIYGAINLSSISAVMPISPDENGSFSINSQALG
ncbi:MAG: DUF952 domain-containing protein [Anaerolineales bacterium]|nr:DUF952 domain-containing protein [Anaerolineales bacterium]